MTPLLKQANHIQSCSQPANSTEKKNGQLNNLYSVNAIVKAFQGEEDLVKNWHYQSTRHIYLDSIEKYASYSM